MQFTTFALSALSVAGALAQSTSTSPSGAMTTVHVVRVGGANAALTFSPDNVKANVGDMVQFQFAPKNHSVVTSTFDAPCAPAGSVFSGYMPVSPNATTTATYTIAIQDTKPLWLYCSQGKHCQSGMVMVINQPASGNKTLAAYKELAAKATSNTAPSSPSGGSGGSNSTSGGTSNSGSGTSGGGSASPTEGAAGAGSSGAATSSGAAGATQSTTASASTISTSASLGLLVMVAAFFL